MVQVVHGIEEHPLQINQCCQGDEDGNAEVDLLAIDQDDKIYVFRHDSTHHLSPAKDEDDEWKIKVLGVVRDVFHD